MRNFKPYVTYLTYRTLTNIAVTSVSCWNISKRLRYRLQTMYRDASASVARRGGSKGWPGGTPLPMRAVAPCAPRNETGCKVAKLHNTCIYSVASHSWCQITPFTQSCIMTSEILAPPKYRNVFYRELSNSWMIIYEHELAANDYVLRCHCYLQ